MPSQLSFLAAAEAWRVVHLHYFPIKASVAQLLVLIVGFWVIWEYESILIA